MPDVPSPTRRAVSHTVWPGVLANTRREVAMRTRRAGGFVASVGGACPAWCDDRPCRVLGPEGRGGRTGAITLCRRERDELVDEERWTVGRDELAYALEAPVWGRYRSFTGHPLIHGSVTWLAAERCVVVAGRRGGARFEETIV